MLLDAAVQYDIKVAKLVVVASKDLQLLSIALIILLIDNYVHASAEPSLELQRVPPATDSGDWKRPTEGHVSGADEGHGPEECRLQGPVAGPCRLPTAAGLVRRRRLAAHLLQRPRPANEGEMRASDCLVHLIERRETQPAQVGSLYSAAI